MHSLTLPHLLWMLFVVPNTQCLLFPTIVVPITTTIPHRSFISHTPMSLYSSKRSTLTSWVIENLEIEEDKEEPSLIEKSTAVMNTVTTYSDEKVGENDTLPAQGLSIGPFRILASMNPRYNDTHTHNEDVNNNISSIRRPFIPIRLLKSRNGWGSGVHPTTRLCLEFLAYPNIIQPGNVFLDYGCGSGILTIAALKLGCDYAHGVDIEAEALLSTERNIVLNKVMYLNSIQMNHHRQNEYDTNDNENDDTLVHERRFKGWHAREIIPYGLKNDHGNGADLCVANILIGQLVRPSMVSTIVSNLLPGAWLCLSGIRPDEVNSLKAAYNNYVDWDDDMYAELAAQDVEFSIESYGFDVGTWSRVVGRIKMNVQSIDSRNFSEEAVS